MQFRYKGQRKRKKEIKTILLILFHRIFEFMERINFIDTEGRDVELQKPIFNLDVWNVRINNEVYAGITKGYDGKWVGSSSRLDSSDLDALISIIDEHEKNKKK